MAAVVTALAVWALLCALMVAWLAARAHMHRTIKARNAGIVCALVVAALAAAPAIGRSYEPRPDPPIHLTAVHAHNLRVLLNEWGA